MSSLLSTLTYNLCDLGEGVLVETPNYGMFEADLIYQNGLKLIFVPTEGVEDRFSASYSAQLVAAYEKALQTASEQGITVRAVLICNPCNPLGRCYSRDSLIRLAEFCYKNRLHLVSDEIYALSAGPATPDMDAFTSVLSLSQCDVGPLPSTHILSGASKDFGLGGLRLGWMITRNSLVWDAVRRLGFVLVLSTFPFIQKCRVEIADYAIGP